MVQSRGASPITDTLLLLLVPIMAAAAVLIITRVSINTYIDSAICVDGAQNIIEGDGYSTTIYDTSGNGLLVPITAFPPGLSMLLIPFGVVAGNILGGARFLFVLLFFASTLVLGLLTKYATGSTLASVAGIILFVVSANVIYTYTILMSEGPFILTTLIAISAIVRFVESRKPLALMITTAFALCSFYIRFTGIVTIGTVILAVLVLTPATLPTRMKDAALVSLISGIGVSGLAIYNTTTAGQLAGEGIVRGFGYWPISGTQWQGLLAEIAKWVTPIGILHALPWPFYLMIALVLLVSPFGIVLWVTRSSHPTDIDRRGRTTASVLGIFAFAYLTFIILARSFADGSIDFSQRQLIGLYISILLIAVIAGTLSVKKYPLILLHSSLAILVVAVVAMNLRRSYPDLADQVQNGAGYSTISWQTSDTLNYCISLPRSTVIYTNGILDVNMYSDIDARRLPTAVSAADNPSGQVPLPLQNMEEILMAQGGEVIFFEGRNVGPFATPYDAKELKEWLNPDRTIELSDGVVLIFDRRD